MSLYPAQMKERLVRENLTKGVPGKGDQQGAQWVRPSTFYPIVFSLQALQDNNGSHPSRIGRNCLILNILSLLFRTIYFFCISLVLYSDFWLRKLDSTNSRSLDSVVFSFFPQKIPYKMIRDGPLGKLPGQSLEIASVNPSGTPLLMCK